MPSQEIGLLNVSEMTHFVTGET